MSTIDIFSNIMALFWILVQQVCLCYIKWAYEDMMGRASRMRAYMALHGVFFVFLLSVGFDLLLGLDFVYGRLPEGALFFYGRLKWNFFCEVMLVLDALLVVYAWRMYRLYMREEGSSLEASSPMRVRAWDIVVIVVFFAPFLWYHAGMTEAALRHGLDDEQVRTLQFFFIKVANFFYALFEGTAAVLLWRIYRLVRREGVLSHGGN